MQDGAAGRPAAPEPGPAFAMKLAEPAAASSGHRGEQARCSPLEMRPPSMPCDQRSWVRGCMPSTVDGIWGRSTETASRNGSRRAGLSTPFDAAQATTLIQSAASQPSATSDLSEKERQLAQRERELASARSGLRQQGAASRPSGRASWRTAKGHSTPRNLGASQERASGVPDRSAAVPQAGSSPLSDPGAQWRQVSSTAGSTFTRSRPNRDRPLQVRWTSLQVDQPMSGTISEGVFREDRQRQLDALPQGQHP